MTDVLIAGGGLAGGLLAWRLKQARPELSLRVLEQGARLGGAHTWSFHDADLSTTARAWLRPLVERSWPGHDVRFPAGSRRLRGAYHSLTSRHFHETLAPVLGTELRLACDVRELDVTGAVLADGERLGAGCVIDARGLSDPLPFALGYQKFLGRRLRLAAGHGLDAPLLMDARVEQRGGYRFVYVLPWSSRELLVEDTRYSEDPALDRADFRAGIDEYLASQGWRCESIEAEEHGVLPVPMAGDIDAFWRARSGGAARIGMGAALFHPTTGYSLPEAAGLADAIVAMPRLDTATLRRLVEARSRALWRRGAFFRLLNRMLFRAALPAERYKVLQRFYALPEPLIGRFYAGRLNLLDRARLLTGRPPVPVLRAARCVFEERVPA